MPKSLRELVVDEDVAIAEKPVNGSGLRSLIVDEDVKKKLGGNGLQDGLTTNIPSQSKENNVPLLKSENAYDFLNTKEGLSQNTDEQNPYSQLLNTHKDNTTASLEVSKFNLEKDFNDRQSKINASPLLQQFDKPLDEGLSLSQAKGEAGNVVGIANPNMGVGEYNKSVIFSNPQALKKYRQIRESEINANTSKLKQDESNLPEAHRFITKDAQAEYFKDNPAYQQLQAAITKNKDYKDELKKSVADIAKIIIPKKEIESGKPIDIQKIGEEYLKVVGDPQVGDDAKTLHAIDKGLEKTQEDIDRSKQNIQYRFFKTGANVLSDYYINHSDDLYKKAKPKIEILQQLFNDQQAVETDESKGIIQNHINDYLQDDDVKNYIDATRNAIGYYNKSQNAAEQFPQVQRAINRQKLNDAFFELNKIKDNEAAYIPGGIGYNALKYVVGAQPSKDEIPLLASMAGISEDEAQKIYDEKIKGFIGEAPTGVRIDGLLLGLAKGTDETLAKSLMGVRRFLHTDDVEAKNRLLNDRLVNYNLESQHNKLKDDFDKWNINPYSIFNTMGNGIGQTAIYGLPALATGGFTEGALLKDSKLLANLSKKIVEGSATVATGYAGSYEDSYKEAAKYTDDEKLRRAYANVTAYENALPELLLSPAEVLKKVGIGKKIGGETFEAFAKDAAKEGIEKTVSQRLVKSLKEFANVVGAENIEEQATNISNISTKESQLGVETSPQDAINQAIETAVQTTITTLPLGIGAGINANNDESGIRKEGLFEAGNEPDLYKEKLKTLFDNGVLNQEQYNKKVQVVNTMQNIVAAVNKTTKANGKPLTYDEKANLAAQQFRIDNNNFILKNNPIAANEKIIEADNNEALNIQNEILIGKKDIPSQLKTETNEEAILPEAKAEGETVNAREGEAAKATPSFTGLRDDDFAKQYFNDEEYRKWSAAEIDDADLAKQMIADKKEQLKSVPIGTPEEISQPIELNPEITNEPVRTDTEERKTETKIQEPATQTVSGSTKDNERITPIESQQAETGITETSQAPTEHAINIKNKFREQFKAKGVSDEHIDGAIALMDARAKSWASEENGRKPEQWYHQIADIKSGEFEASDIQYQKGGLKAVVAGVLSTLHPIEIKENIPKITPPIQTEIKATPKEIEIRDNRTIDAISGTKLSDTKRLSTTTDVQTVKDIVQSSIKHEVDPYTMLAIAMNESGISMEEGNPLHAFDETGHVITSGSRKEDLQLLDTVMKKFVDKMKIADNLNKKSEADRIQAYNGYGKVGSHTEGEHKSYYGIDVTKSPIDMNKNPVYGKRIIDIRDNIIKKNHELVKLVESEKKNIAYQEQEGVKRGALETIKDGRVIIHALDSPDVSTMVHEIFHVFEKDLTDTEKKQVNDFGGNEAFARAGERYLRNGIAPTKELQPLFQKFRNWLINIYQSLKGSPIEKRIAPEIKQIFDRLLTEKPKQDNSVIDKAEPEETAKEQIDNYKMSTSDEVNKFLSGETIDDVFGEAPEGEQSYYVQKLTDMLQDGKNMIAKAMSVWGSDIAEYGKPLFGYIQNMSNDNQLTNKKAVLLATFLGELKEAIIREPERAGELRQLNNAVESYYQNYMNIKGKEVVAGRLLRLYRDHYIGDIFTDKILEEKEIKDKRNILKAEQDAKKIDDLVAAKVREQLTAQQKKDADAANNKASDKDKKTNDKKKSLTQKDAQAKADKKLSEIKDRLGKDGDKGLIGKINDLINKLNCK